MADDTAISYLAAVPGTPVLSSTGTQIGTLEHFIDADAVLEITRSHIRCSLDDAQASQLPPPDGPPVYRVDALEDTGKSFHDVLGRLFRRPHWTRERD